MESTMAATYYERCEHCGWTGAVCVQDGSGKDPAAGMYKWTCPECGKGNRTAYQGTGTQVDYCGGTDPVAMPA